MVGDWKRLYSDQFHSLYTSVNVIRMIRPKTRWVRHVARMEERKNAYKIFVQTQGKKEISRTRRRW